MRHVEVDEDGVMVDPVAEAIEDQRRAMALYKQVSVVLAHVEEQGKRSRELEAQKRRLLLELSGFVN